MMPNSMKSELAAFWSLARQFSWWELVLVFSFLSFFLFKGLHGIPTLGDEGVYSKEDIILGSSCQGSGRNERIEMHGASGRRYVLGGHRSCSSSKAKRPEYYVGREVTAYYLPGRDSPIQLDFEGGGGYKAGIKTHKVAMYVMFFGFPVFFMLLMVAKKRRGDYKKESGAK